VSNTDGDDPAEISRGVPTAGAILNVVLATVSSAISNEGNLSSHGG